MILVFRIRNKKTIKIFENLEFMENTENSCKSKIMSSFLFAVFTYTVLHGGDRLIMKEGLELG